MYLTFEPVIVGAANVSQRALDLTSKEARQSDMGVIAKIASVDVPFPRNKIEDATHAALYLPEREAPESNMGVIAKIGSVDVPSPRNKIGGASQAARHNLFV